MKPPREGSRKADVYAVFIKSGLEAAIAKAVSLELKANTVKAWASSWGGGTKRVSKDGKPAPDKAPAVPMSPNHIHFDIPTRARAVVHLQGIMRRTGMAEAAFHILEQDGKFGVVPIHLDPNAKVPTFQVGDWVCDTIIPDTLGKIVAAGPQQCTVRYEKPRPGYMTNETHIPNVYLVKVPAPAIVPGKKKRAAIVEEKKPAKKSRVKIETPESKGFGVTIVNPNAPKIKMRSASKDAATAKATLAKAKKK